MTVILPTAKFVSTGGKFSNFHGTLTNATYAAYADFSERTEGFFLRIEITPDPGEELDEVLVRNYSGGNLKFRRPGTSLDESSIVDLEATDDAQLCGHFCHGIGRVEGHDKNGNIASFFDHLNNSAGFDQSRWDADIYKSLVGLYAFWIEVPQPERIIAGKRQMRKTKSGEEVVPTFLAPDKVISYTPQDQLPKLGVAAAPAADPAKEAELEKFILAAASTAGGSITQAAVSTALINGGQMQLLSHLKPAFLLGASRPWTVKDEVITLS